MEFKHYLQELDKNLEKGSERTHYPALKNLIEGAMLGINANIEETGNQAGIPDFKVRKNIEEGDRRQETGDRRKITWGF
ncbi:MULTISPECIES: hypothetical protein [Okeania]|uniref:Uncharacterized protein n=2 Tax=Okeania hirsuta TaxID=1458930 RepID=A0A3N6PNZ7_9CYAN|nr:MULTISPECIES: hypothetical protein [Okeania]NET79383.1 hypothetical protein [Okeania sp. SIO1F9]RQH21824.1 hypothetical protein D4Z78_08780 [Okeania hirsuta]RQH33507.1 hypothetical protein D5R40_21415 [Okeania hirsuta]